VPHATLEALSTGLPIITTDSVGARECVADAVTPAGASKRGRNGFLCPPRDVDALAQAMQHLLDHPDQIAPMGRASRRLAEEVFDVQLVNQIILDAMKVAPPLATAETFASASCPQAANA
jgi:glycosyltransferase involved in cell wall biosynthesis